MPRDVLKRQARTGSGEPVHAASGVLPVLKEVTRGQLRVIGTGFFITRYGLFITAAHVIKDLVDSRGLGIGYVLHVPEPYQGNLHLRKIQRVTFFDEVDLAIGQADNFVKKFPDNPLGNLRCILSGATPSTGQTLFTYAYPESEDLVFDGENTPKIRGDCFEGRLLSVIDANQNRFISYAHYATSIRVRSGASGGPVFNESGDVIGVNCRGWDFDGGDHDGEELSSIVPVKYVLAMEVNPLQLPQSSWEYRQLPVDAGSSGYTVGKLVEYGHIAYRAAA